ncbi:enolase C-terminal domain-like protein [Marinimicrobium sp. ABcell2]|uniref:enolase C-terminal domain-like protein n=1 Tax=Marinimicrobium sp. ABcell2 TaxID=3069751 RepID=UPI0027AE9E5D|nr:enolase C-terminal domain-like protein [Marinimicrobium sp. ABcell2]MDQ2075374.1 enolase C-terminal domain-like protein [Marinimicrobium sp. ABcell2]
MTACLEGQGPLIESVEVAAYRVPTDDAEGDGTFHWSSTELLVVQIRAGDHVGLGYSYTGGLAAAALVRDTLAPSVMGSRAVDLPSLWLHMNQSLRNIGRPGLGLMAASAMDIALWDLKGKLLNISLSTLWGNSRAGVPVYGSGGFTTYTDEQLRSQLADWMELGLTAVKIKLGLILEEDIRRVALAREVVGPDVELMVDANGAYNPRTALDLIERLHHWGICWLEEPVSSDNLEGLSWLRDRTPSGIAIAAGEYGWGGIYFRRMLETHAVDILQADATRCGYSGFIQAAQLCEAFQIPLSAHCAPAVHTALCATLPNFKHIEYFHDHVRLEKLLFEHVPELRNGKLWPNRERAGHGLAFRSEHAAPFLLDECGPKTQT